MKRLLLVIVFALSANPVFASMMTYDPALLQDFDLLWETPAGASDSFSGFDAHGNLSIDLSLEPAIFAVGVRRDADFSQYSGIELTINNTGDIAIGSTLMLVTEDSQGELNLFVNQPTQIQALGNERLTFDFSNAGHLFSINNLFASGFIFTHETTNVAVTDLDRVVAFGFGLGYGAMGAANVRASSESININIPHGHVPAPATLMLILGGVLGLALSTRKK